MWVPTADLPQSAGHPFYERLNRVFDDERFDAFAEAHCASCYADGIGRPSLAPGRYIRLLLLGYFEWPDSERAIAWRAIDSLSIRTFLDCALQEAPPNHSTLSWTRRLIDLQTHQAVCTWGLQRLADATLVVGRTVAIDATKLEANAAMRSLVRRDTGESDDALLTRLSEVSRFAKPTRAALARLDLTGTKQGSNADWTHPHVHDAKITKMKDGRTHLAHTADQAIDLETGAIMGVTVQHTSAGDTTTLVETLLTAADDGRDRGHRRPQLLLGAGSRLAPLEGPDGCAGRGVHQSAADSGRARLRAAAPAGRAVATAHRASLRDRRDPPRASARASQIPETAARPGLRHPSRDSHAAPHGRRPAAEPPGPHGASRFASSNGFATSPHIVTALT